MTEDSPLARRISAELHTLRARTLYRERRPPSGIDLSSNDYLGLSRHPRLARAMADAARDEGCGSTGSRLLRGERRAFRELEARFAGFKGVEASLYFSSGYLANLAVLTTLPRSGDVVFCDAANHASLIDGVRLSRAERIIFPHNDAASLQRLMGRARRTAAADAVLFVVVESVFSMDGDEAPVAVYAELCRSYGAVLIVDEAHAVGVFGARGSGLIEDAGLDHAAAAGPICVSVNSAGKALGVAGAFVAGPAWVVDYLVQNGRPFVFSTAPPPPIARALDVSLDVIGDEPSRRTALLELAQYVRSRLHAAGLDIPAGRGPIVPVVLGDNERAVAVAASLQRDGFDVRAIRPPTVPEGTARLRVSVNATLDRATLDRFGAALSRALATVATCSAASS